MYEINRDIVYTLPNIFCCSLCVCDERKHFIFIFPYFRSNKRYYYQNRATGLTQWEYPQPDFQRYDEAMDISTTPPPEQIITMSPPLPPAIRSPTPPPPPIISLFDENKDKIGKKYNMKLY